MEKDITKSDVFDFLNDHTVAILTTVSGEYTPVSSAMYYTVNPALNFFFLTKSDTQRLAHIKDNNNVAIVVLGNDAPVTVQVQGVAEHITDPLAERDVVNKIAEKSAKLGKAFWPPPVSQLQDGEMVIFKVTPTNLRYCDFYHGKPHEARIVQLIP